MEEVLDSETGSNTRINNLITTLLFMKKGTCPMNPEMGHELQQNEDEIVEELEGNN